MNQTELQDYLEPEPPPKPVVPDPPPPPNDGDDWKVGAELIVPLPPGEENPWFTG